MKFIYLSIGSISLILGLIGIVLPVLPTTPFLILTAICYAKGSTKFYNWFINTKIYKNHLESFIKNKAMTLKKKVIILSAASIALLTAFYFVNFWHARLLIALIIVLKYYYFIFKIKTIKE